MGLIQQLTDPDPGTIWGLLAWLGTEAGWSVATSLIIAGLIWLWHNWRHVELSDFAKTALAYALPVVIVVGSYCLQALFGYEAWSFETLYERVYAAVLVLIGAQFAYLKVGKPLAAWWKARNARQTTGA